ncbi:energy-coupling factor ABC transporter permease [Tissierella sp. MSJ-40]|uniref:Cobalt transport protein CbiM n=1 Tax=Tissierella simiarum TaxID=2841534 RepID=A0ABS6E3E6_9FIRM|nr:energy-coupling factor ABC transporter permease [Tissierella simiarum]MBU5437430.1 energy-coupling factor ABC transporter permease [Tissierella simiarum]
MKKRKVLFGVIMLTLVVTPQIAQAMHIMEGFLPLKWAVTWAILSLPFLFIGFKRVGKLAKEDQNKKVLLGLAGGFVFVLSALKIPSVTGSCSHPTGVGLGAILFGPTTMTVLGTIVLLFQALLLAHGGITTLGANIFSMAIVGPLISYGIYKGMKKKNMNTTLSVFLAACLGDLATYIITAIQLSLAFPDPIGGIGASLVKFLTVFAVTQIPLAIVEGIITSIIFNLLLEYNKEGVIDIETIR